MLSPFGHIRGLSLDFYNTLVHPRAVRGRGAMLMEYLREQGLESDPWEHQILYDVFERHHVDYTPDLPGAEAGRYRQDLARRLFRRLGVRAPDVVAAEHAAHLWELLGPACLAVYPEVPGVLRILRNEGLPMAVVSNWQCGLGHFCTELGLGGLFDPVLASAEVGSAKPEAAIFVEACRRLGLAPSRVLHVGDSGIDDVEGARGAGLGAALLRRDEGPTSGAVPVLRSLQELPSLLGLEDTPAFHRTG